MSKVKQLGSSGKYPNGKLNADDLGELAFSVSVQGKSIMINFNTAVKWFALYPDQAREFASLLNKHADLAENPRKD
jgi:hypothetical protein